MGRAPLLEVRDIALRVRGIVALDGVSVEDGGAGKFQRDPVDLLVQGPDRPHLEGLPGIKVNTNPADFYPIKQILMARFDGKRWVLFGPVISA